jgi:hypothetical protein
MIVDVILPCLNEAPALPWILSRMPAGFRPIVVDNGSTDGSGEIAVSLGATVVSESALPRVGKSKVTGTVGGCVRTVRDMSQVLSVTAAQPPEPALTLLVIAPGAPA